jgi:putative peptide zinc metalloprotease protein
VKDSAAHQVREPITATLRLREDLIFTPDPARDRPGYTVEDPLRGKFFRLGTAEYAFLVQLDGRRSIAEAVGRAAVRLGPQALSAHEALALCHWAVESQLAQPAGNGGSARIAAAAARHERQRVRAMANPLCVRIPLIDPDRLLSRIAGWCGPVFTWPAAGVWTGLVGYALYLAASGWTRIESSAAVVLDRENWLRLAAAWVLLKVLHETAHGLACKRYGGAVGSAGITFLFLMPLAYVDVTSSWRFRSKWQRIATAAAGMYAELFVASVATIVWAASSPGALQTMALNVALTAGASTLVFNANPLVRFDGYFILSDLLGLPNLCSCGQQWMADFVQTHVLGRETATPPWPQSKAWIVRLYAVAALAWRVLFFLTLALMLVGTLGHAGMLLAGLLLGFAWGVPLVQAVRRLRRMAAGKPMNVRRVAASMAVSAAAVVVVAAMLARPGRVAAPAVVEYAPLSIVRASTPGFVEEVLVASGDAVVAGQPIVVLRNDELEAELADLELAQSESLVRSCVLIQAQEPAKLQVEAADRAAIEKKIAELKPRVASLTVRAAVAGRLYARDFAALRGRYLQPGEEIAVLGSEEAKELLVAVPQDDVDLFADHLGLGVVRARTASGDCVAARLTSIGPRGGSELPHAALSAAVGGPLPVKPAARTEGTTEKPGPKCELVAPVFQGKAALTADDSRRLHAGQLTTVSFRTKEETIAIRIYRNVQRWMGRILHTPFGRQQDVTARGGRRRYAQGLACYTASPNLNAFADALAQFSLTAVGQAAFESGLSDGSKACDLRAYTIDKAGHMAVHVFPLRPSSPIEKRRQAAALRS